MHSILTYLLTYLHAGGESGYCVGKKTSMLLQLTETQTEESKTLMKLLLIICLNTELTLSVGSSSGGGSL